MQKFRFALRNPPFYPLNYGNDDREGINGLKEDGQDALRSRIAPSQPLLSILGRKRNYDSTFSLNGSDATVDESTHMAYGTYEILNDCGKLLRLYR